MDVFQAHTSPAPPVQAQQDSPGEPGHRCGICGKTFERRDLRDRHKRRCTHTFDKPKRSKRRSCLSCAVSKLGCDQAQPSCRRCVTRGTPCEYVGDAPGSDGEAKQPSGPPSSSGTGTELVAMDLSGMDDINGTTRAPDAMPWNLDLDTGLAGYSYMGDMSYGMSSNGDEWLGTTMEKGGIDFGSLWGPSIERRSEQSTYDSERFTAFRPDLSSRASSSYSAHVADGSGLALGGSSHYSPMGTPSLVADSTHQSHVPAMKPEDMVGIIMGYLPMMIALEPPAPPFVHSQIYRCGEGDVKEPIARAMICIQAHIAAMPSGRPFVHDMVNKERDKLVKSFHTCQTEIDMMAALHAMFVLQALSFFGDSEAQVRGGELHHPFMLKMIRNVAHKYRSELVNNHVDSSFIAWRQWAFIETLRRTISIIHIVNVVSARLKKQNQFFYEALDDELLLDMPLPAPAHLWDAATEGQWLVARSKLPQTMVTGRMVLQEGASMPEDADAFTRMLVGCLVPDDLSTIGN